MSHTTIVNKIKFLISIFWMTKQILRNIQCSGILKKCPKFYWNNYQFENTIELKYYDISNEYNFYDVYLYVFNYAFLRKNVGYLKICINYIILKLSYKNLKRINKYR